MLILDMSIFFHDVMKKNAHIQYEHFLQKWLRLIGNIAVT
jgi:hypothetical protein